MPTKFTLQIYARGFHINLVSGIHLHFGKCLNTCLWNLGTHRHKIARLSSAQFCLVMFLACFFFKILHAALFGQTRVFLVLAGSSENQSGKSALLPPPLERNPRSAPRYNRKDPKTLLLKAIEPLLLKKFKIN